MNIAPSAGNFQLRFRPTFLALAVGLFLLVPALRAQEAPSAAAPAPAGLPPVLGVLNDGDTVVFIGDHIVERGEIVPLFQTFLSTRFPGRDIRVINSGEPSETLSGLDEPPGSGKARPVLFTRYETDVAAFRPALVIACYGMNDGVYAPLKEERFVEFRKGFAKMVKLVTDETKARLLVLTPPNWEGQGADPAKDIREESTYTHNKPFAGYFETLQEMARWEREQRYPGLAVLDLNTRMRAHTEERRRVDREFKLYGQHHYGPNSTGYLLMAATLLQGMGAPPLVADLKLNLSEMASNSPETVKDLRFEDNAFHCTWTSPIPMPMLSTWDTKSVALEQIKQSLNIYRLSIAGLRPGRYTLSTELGELGTYTAEELAAGLDLTQFEKLAPNLRAQAIHKLHWDGRSLFSGLKRQNPAPSDQEESLLYRIRALSRPTNVYLKLAPAGE